VPAIAAGLAQVPAGVRYLAVLAADLPLLTPAAVNRLRRAAAGPGRDGAVFVDHAGRPQWLCGVWRAGALRNRLAGRSPRLAGTPVRRLLGELATAELTDPGAGPPPWWDCDTGDDLRRAEDWTRITGTRETGNMANLDDWTAAAGRSLGLDPAEADAHRTLVLDLARETAHGVARPAAPVTAYLLGLAVGRGADPATAAARLTELARDWPAPEPPAPAG
jgi:hypothetical protein